MANFLNSEELEAVKALVDQLNYLDSRTGVKSPVDVRAILADVNGENLGYVVYDGRGGNYVYSKSGRL